MIIKRTKRGIHLVNDKICSIRSVTLSLYCIALNRAVRFPPRLNRNVDKFVYRTRIKEIQFTEVKTQHKLLERDVPVLCKYV
jgi:hypothetical protein